MAQTTYNQIVNRIEELCDRHLQIHTFFCGKEWNFQAGTENIYPAVVLFPLPSVINRGQIVITFSMFVVDILNKDRTNLNEIHSDTLQIITDLIAELKDDEDTYGFWLDDENVVIEPIEEVLDDVLGGWNCTVGITIKYTGTSCGLPIDE